LVLTRAEGAQRVRRLPVTKFLPGFGRRLREVTSDGNRFLVMFL